MIQSHKLFFEVNNINISDIIIVDNCELGLKQQVSKIIYTANKTGFDINEEKTECMIVQKNALTEDKFNCVFIEVYPYKFKRVQQFKYLNTIIT